MDTNDYLSERIASLEHRIVKRVTELEQEITQMRQIVEAIAQFPDKNITLQKACKLKGISYGSINQSANRWKRPGGGVPDKVINGRAYWRPETVRDWILMDDAELWDRYGKHVKEAVPPKQVRAVQPQK